MPIARGRRVDGEHVPVEGRRAATLMAVSSSISSSLNVSRQPYDGLERCALVRGHRPAQGQHLAPLGMPRADRPAVAVGVGARPGGGEAEPAGVQRLGQERPIASISSSVATSSPRAAPMT